MQVLATLHVQPKPEATKLKANHQIRVRLVLHGMDRAGGLTPAGDADAKLVFNLVEGSALCLCTWRVLTLAWVCTW